MSKTALAWLLMYCLAAVSSFLDPLYGMLGYLLEYYMRPDLYWWGKQLPDFRWNLLISIVFGLSFLMRRDALRQLREVPNLALPWFLGLLAVMVLVTGTVAVNKSISWNWTVQWTKMALIIPLLMAGAIRTRGAFNAFAAAHMIGATWWGYQAWTDPHRKAGRLLEVGSGDTLNDNAASAHLLTVLPFIGMYLLTQKDRRMQGIALIAAPFVINTLILCNSRGSMVGLGVAAMSAFLMIRSGYRFRMFGAAIAIALGFLLLADPEFITRQQTTTEYQKGTAAERLETWQAGLGLIRDRPLGSGGRGFHLLSGQYIPSIVADHDGDPRAPHNTYVMIGSEWGVLGLVCFFGAFINVFRMLRRVQKNAATQDFYYWAAFAIQTGLTGALVASTFTDRLYGEANYWMAGLAYALYRLQATEQEGVAPVPVPAPIAATPAFGRLSPASNSVS